MHLPDLEKQTAMKTLPSLTVPIVVLLSLCSAWILLCCHVESLGLGRKCNHGHESTYMVGRYITSEQAACNLGEVLWGSISLSHI